MAKNKNKFKTKILMSSVPLITLLINDKKTKSQDKNTDEFCPLNYLDIVSCTENI